MFLKIQKKILILPESESEISNQTNDHSNKNFSILVDIPLFRSVLFIFVFFIKKNAAKHVKGKFLFV